MIHKPGVIIFVKSANYFTPCISKSSIGVILEVMILENVWPSYLVFLTKEIRIMAFGANEIESICKNDNFE